MARKKSEPNPEHIRWLQEAGIDVEKYYLGRLCKHGHGWNGTGLSLRNLSKKDCLVCLRDRQREHDKTDKAKATQRRCYVRNRQTIIDRMSDWKRNNPEKMKAANARRYKKYRAKFLARNKVDSQKNRLKINERQRRYRKTDKGREKIYKAVYARFARKKNAPRIDYTLSELALHFALFGDRCVYCQGVEKLTIDHLVPLSKGGIDALTNIVPACKPCNSSKRDKSAYLWFNQRPQYSTEKWFFILNQLISVANGLEIKR